MQSEPWKTLSRREFVRRLSAATAGGGLLTAAFAGCALSRSQGAEATEVLVSQMGKLPRRPLGKMGLEVTPIVICQDWNPDLYAPALKMGVNYVHKAGYWNELPDAFKKIPRESYITDITVDSTPNNPDDEDSAYNQVVESLRRNGLGYYDIFKAHYGWKSVDALKQQRGTHRAFARLKREGKVKHFGVSQHDFVPYPEIIAAEVQEGLIETMQVFFSYGSPVQNQQVFDAAHKAGVGMIAMKTFAYGGEKMRADTARQQALKAPGMPGRSVLRHVLSVPGSDGRPIFSACVSSLQSFEQFEENMGAAATRTAMADGFSLLA